MPTISMFYGILIRMFFRDIEKHHVPHIHADYQGRVGAYSIPAKDLTNENHKTPSSTQLGAVCCCR